MLCSVIMNTAVTVLVILLPYGGLCLRCYGCTGYDPSLPYDRVSNNPACADRHFVPLQVKVYSLYGVGHACFAFTYTVGDEKVTQRYMVHSSGSIHGRSSPGEGEGEEGFALARYGSTEDYAYVHGYYCHSDLCNDVDAGSPSLTVFSLLSLLLPVMLGVVVVVTRL